MKKALLNGQIVFNDRIESMDIIMDETILEIGTNLNTEGCEIIDVKGAYVSSGFIDIHIHGSKGADVMDGKKSSLDIISEAVLKNGVTSFLATTMTMSKQDIKKSFETVSDYMKSESKGANILGIHVEGPFINKSYKGAQNGSYIIPPDYDMIKSHMDIIRLMTIAPEVEGTLDFVKRLKNESSQIKFSIGHSAATFEQAINGYETGIDSTTHLFNGMTGLHHRNPGIVGAVFKKKPYFEVIADKIHVHEGLFDVLGDCIGKDKMILVTDAMCACQMDPGEYDLGGQLVVVDDTSARLKSGTLAGSILRMNDALRNLKSHTDYKLYDLINMVTLNPATMLGLEKIGKVETGYHADLTVFDKDMKVQYTIVNGTVKYGG